MKAIRGKIIPGCEPVFLAGGEAACLLLHGFTNSPFEMKPMGEFLNRQGYTVSIPLIPGHGTIPADLRKTKWTDWYEGSKVELFKLRKKYKKVYIIGFSMGASLALHLSAHYEVDGVITLAPVLYLKNKFSFLSHFIHHFFPYSKKLSGPDISSGSETVSYNKIPVKSISELLKFSKHLRPDLRDIYIPVLIIHARQDHVVDNKSAREIYHQIASKNKRILELQESYHIMTLDIEQERVFKESLAFLNVLKK